MTIDYNLGLVSLNEELVWVPLQTEFKQRNLVTNVEAVCLPVDAEALINVRCPRYFEGKTFILEAVPSLQFNVCAAARSLGRCINGKTFCTVFNRNPVFSSVAKGYEISFYSDH